VPAINYIGSFATAPATSSYTQNAVYLNTTNGNSYILTGSPLAWTLYLSKGTDGVSGANYWLTTSATVIRRSVAGGLNPSTITFRGFYSAQGGTPTSFAGRFSIAFTNDDVTWGQGYTSSVNESSTTYSIPANAVAVRCQFYLPNGTTLIDEETVRVIFDGSDGLNIVLSNSSATVPASNTGVVSSFANAQTTVSIYQGSTDVSANWTITKTDTNLTSTLTGRSVAVSSMTADSGYVTFTATRTGFPTLTATFNVSKAKQGVTGTNGTNGADGPRGSLAGYGARYGMSNSSWYNEGAQAVIYNMIYGANLTYTTSTWFLRIGDTVTLSGPNFAETRYWGGTSWLSPGVVIDGNLLVSGTISGDKISANSIEGDKIITNTLTVNKIKGDVNVIVPVQYDPSGYGILNYGGWVTAATATLAASTHPEGHTPSAIITCFLENATPSGTSSGAIRLLIDGVQVAESHSFLQDIATLTVAGSVSKKIGTTTFTLQVAATNGSGIWAKQIRGFIMGVR
jgi:hypothetical protein